MDKTSAVTSAIHWQSFWVFQMKSSPIMQGNIETIFKDAVVHAVATK